MLGLSILPLSTRHWYVCFIHWLAPRKWHWSPVKNGTFRQSYDFNSLLWTFHLYARTSSPAYGVYISHLIRYSRDHDCLDRLLLLTRTIPNQGFLVDKLKSSLRMFYGRHHELVNCYGIYIYICSKWPRICSASSFTTYHRVCSKSNTTSVICVA